MGQQKRPKIFVVGLVQDVFSGKSTEKFLVHALKVTVERCPEDVLSRVDVGVGRHNGSFARREAEVGIKGPAC